MERLKQRVALVSGGARGIGEAIARRFVGEGARVVVGDVRDSLGERVAATLGDRARYVHLDVTSESDWGHAVAVAEEHFGALNVLVNNAGVFEWIALEDYPLERYRAVIEVNQVGCFLGMKCAVPALKRNGGGAIVNISSIAGISGVANAIAYTASKYAVTGMSASAALELKPLNIRVNSVHPGFVRTPLTIGTPEEPGTMPPSTPGGAEPGAIADVVLFLASDEARNCTGAQFVADGGDRGGGADSGLASGIETQRGIAQK